jgi:hypothetical protein
LDALALAVFFSFGGFLSLSFFPSALERPPDLLTLPSSFSRSALVSRIVRSARKASCFGAGIASRDDFNRRAAGRHGLRTENAQAVSQPTSQAAACRNSNARKRFAWTQATLLSCLPSIFFITNLIASVSRCENWRPNAFNVGPVHRSKVATIETV